MGDWLWGALGVLVNFDLAKLEILLPLLKLIIAVEAFHLKTRLVIVGVKNGVVDDFEDRGGFRAENERQEFT